MRYRDIERLANRQVLAPHLQRALTEPDATLGWNGDPDLVLAHNTLLDAYEVWREEAWFDPTDDKWHTVHKIILRAPSGAEPTVPELIRNLVARDTTVADRSHKKAMDDYIKGMEKDAEDRAKAEWEKARPVIEEVAWTLSKADGDLAPVVAFPDVIHSEA